MNTTDLGNEILNDWRPETRSLLRALVKAGFTIDAVSDGEEWTQGTPAVAIPAAVKILTSVDESQLTVWCPDSTALKQLWLVFGNSPGELVSDYTTGSPLLDATLAEHSDKWGFLTQPKTTARKLYPKLYSK
jgi:hypothetical protein